MKLARRAFFASVQKGDFSELWFVLMLANRVILFLNVYFHFHFQASGGGYDGLSNIKMEQDSMAPLGNMKVRPS